jgi:hypothetical protein
VEIHTLRLSVALPLQLAALPLTLPQFPKL